MSRRQVIGFIGLGVMGEPICRNLVKKSGARVVAFDIAIEPMQRLRAEGAETGRSVADVVRQSELVFLCLPSAKHVRQVFEGDGILENTGKGQVVVDLGTSSVSQTRDFAERLHHAGRDPGRAFSLIHLTPRTNPAQQSHGPASGVHFNAAGVHFGAASQRLLDVVGDSPHACQTPDGVFGGFFNLRVNSPLGKPDADGDDRSKAITISGFEVGFEMTPPAG